jgi:hypothetical protein
MVEIGSIKRTLKIKLTYRTIASALLAPYNGIVHIARVTLKPEEISSWELDSTIKCTWKVIL